MSERSEQIREVVGRQALQMPDESYPDHKRPDDLLFIARAALAYADLLARIESGEIRGVIAEIVWDVIVDASGEEATAVADRIIALFVGPTEGEK